MQLKLLNLSRKVTEDELRALFNEYGTVKDCTLVKDEETGASKGFGFVEMEMQQEAEMAMQALHKTKIKGERIRVKLAD